MRIGYYISGAGHIALILFVLFGGMFNSSPEPFEVTEVSVISGAEFEAMMAAAQQPEATTDVAMPTPPAPQEAPPPAESQPDPTPPPPVEPQVTEAPPPDPAPQPAEALPPQPAEVTDAAPVLAPPPQEQVVLAPDNSSRPVPRPAERVAPEPVAAPEPDTRVADTVTEEVVPDAAAETPREETEAGAPEEATTQIVTEAMEKPSAAPTSSIRPRTRPARPDPVAEAPRDPAPQPQQQQAAQPQPSTSDAVNDALRQALEGAGAPSPAAAGQSGPPMTSGERDALRVAVQQCWNVGSLSSEALRTTVVVAVSMSEDGRPMNETLRMLSYDGGSADAARQAFESARRAIIRCGANGFNLPRDKYAQWRDIEMTFNPENMRIR
ncbi:energy transducer TonB [Seohaeicola saemankumensis]|uniref:Energy transducer TonB n=1 Tax=Seohaeicola saemankumensis TaxID=481181 RepID=A0ABW3TA34_9RHOB